MADYRTVLAAANEDPAGFWETQAAAIDWFKPWDAVLSDLGDPVPRWFAGAETNTCHNCLDRHVAAGHGDTLAIVFESPVTASRRTLTYAQLLDQTARFAGVLTEKGIEKGDRVLIYMPNSPEAAIAMLACARIGAVHSVVFGGFAARELATRIDDARPKALIASSCGIEPGRTIAYKPILDEAFAIAEHPPGACLVFQRDECPAELSGVGDFDAAALIATAEPVPCVPVAATDPLYILYTSGTTGQPKGIVRDTGGHMVALAWSMRNLYGVQPGETYWAASDVGWVVGHSYIVYGPLLNRNTTVMFEGKPVGTPDAGVFWRIIEENDVRVFFTAPTAIRAIRQVDPEGAFLGKSDLSGLRAMFLAGERTDPDTLIWSQQKLGKPVVDHWWQTETGWAICGNPLGIEEQPVKEGSTGLPMPGWRVECLGDDGTPVAPGEIGGLAVKLPLPPGAAPPLWRAPERYRTAYLDRYPGYYSSGDAGVIDAEGYVSVMTRVDDVINVAGHRLSTGALEEALIKHPMVAECAVVGAADELKGMVPVGFVVLCAGDAGDDIRAELVEAVRNDIGPVAAFKRVHVVDRLPKTRSGKILRGVIKKVVDGDPYTLPPTVDDPHSIDPVKDAVA